jgi:uncharacterized protein
MRKNRCGTGPTVRLLVVGSLIACPGWLLRPGVASAEQGSNTEVVTALQLAGNYRLPNGTVVGINAFSADGGPPVPLFTDYTTGVVRTLFPLPNLQFGMGPSLGVRTPTERTVRILRDEAGSITALGLRTADEEEVVGQRIPLGEREVTFRNGDITLSGTLLVPSTPGPHPAIALLHGSGRLTRYSFGPYPRFFASLGFAVLVYDKRGTGASTGTFFPRTAVYPEQYEDDAIAAVQFLKEQANINPRKVGLWGTSEGGMLSTVVASREPVAFAINSSGFMMPLWEQVLYNIGAQLSTDGFSASEVADAVRFETFAIDAMRAGDRWDEYSRAQVVAAQQKWWSAYFGEWKGFQSAEDLRWQWEHVYRFDPRPTLQRVKCPVLGLFGGLDTSTPSRLAASNLEEGLRAAGNSDVTVRIFERGNHPLMDARTGGNAEIPGMTRMIPDVFETIRTWLATRIGTAR